MAENRRTKLHIDWVRVSRFHLYHGHARLTHCDALFLSANNSDRLTLSLGELEDYRLPQSLETRFVQSANLTPQVACAKRMSQKVSTNLYR